MSTRCALALCSLLTLLLFCSAGPLFAHPHILKIETGQEIGYRQLLDDLDDVQVIFIGENHDHYGHHQMQFEVIRGLNARKLPLAVGLEMFQVDSQTELDKWVNRDISESDFLTVYERNWSWWPGYSPIFHFARQEAIPMVALNIPREIPRQVARNGFDSLLPDQSKDLEGAPCAVDPTYENFIRRTLGDHSHGHENFIFFCEAQLLWDITMARHLVQFLEKYPDRRVIVLAGSGHSWKYGIPNQMRKISPLTYRVILPEIPGRLDRNSANEEDADYLWLDFGEDSWTVSDTAKKGDS